jgi:hypothetical protein
MRRLRSAAGQLVTETRVSVATPKVGVVILDTRPVFTVSPESFQQIMVGEEVPECEGAIVRVFPPEGTTEEGIGNVEWKLRDSGAVVVRMMPTPRTSTVTADAKAEVATPMAVTRTIRGVVAELVARARTRNPDALREVVEDALAAEEL